MTGDQEYQWSRPGCFKCKEPIGNRDYMEISWVGKTCSMKYNLCARCWEPAENALALGKAEAPAPRDPSQGRNVAV
ncbi:MAG: hypothetical protein ACE5Q6_07620 [Dehalococcoidia bacterium]